MVVCEYNKHSCGLVNFRGGIILTEEFYRSYCNNRNPLSLQYRTCPMYQRLEKEAEGLERISKLEQELADLGSSAED